MPFSEGGVDNFCILGPSEVSKPLQFASLELTTGLETTFGIGALILGRSRALICHFGSDRPFFNNTAAIWRPKHTSFRAGHRQTPVFHGLRPRGRQLWVSPPDFEPNLSTFCPFSRLWNSGTPILGRELEFGPQSAHFSHFRLNLAILAMSSRFWAVKLDFQHFSGGGDIAPTEIFSIAEDY